MEKDIRNNVVFVSRNYFSLDKRRRLFRVGSLKWLSGLVPDQFTELQCKVKFQLPSLIFLASFTTSSWPACNCSTGVSLFEQICV